MYKDLKILIGITGGIAAYKSAELIRALVKNSAQVKVVMTAAAREFITPLTIQTLSKNRVYYDMFQTEYFDIEHIALARWADVILIAPATANFIAKIQCGLADDLLSTIILATTRPIILAPAMNQGMWQNKITQKNIHKLQTCGITFFMPQNGVQACGEAGVGRMQEPKEIIANLTNYLIKNSPATTIFANKNILITAGPTQEAIDIVRFITNKSSGKMGYAMAEVAKNLGANVTLISGPTNLPPIASIKIINVVSAQDMQQAIFANIKACDIFIGAAAIANYTLKDSVATKISSTAKKLTLTLEKTPDIISAVTQLPKPPFTVGFAAQSENLIANANKKLKKKNLNMVIANLINIEGQGFSSDNNAVTVISKNKKVTLDKANKKIIAEQIFALIGEEYTQSGNICKI